MKSAVCAVARNENAYLLEWIDYHLNLGFDKIFLYDNNDPEDDSGRGTNSTIRSSSLAICWYLV